MAFDPYAYCPGGTGKKIKFCCSDLLPDLEKLDRMLEGDQFHAALAHLDRLESRYGDRACLLSTRALVQRIIGQTEQAQATVARFLEKHPNNPVALGESAILTALAEGGRAGMEVLQRALEASGPTVQPRVVEAMRVVGTVLAADGEYLPARAVLGLIATADRHDAEVMETLVRLNTHPGIPLLLKSGLEPAPVPETAPWKAGYEEAMQVAHDIRWAEAARRLADLAARYPEEPAIWQSLGIVRAWSADAAGAAAAFEKLATLDLPLENAVETLAVARLLSDDPLGDAVDVVDVTYPVADAEQLQSAFSASPRVALSRVDPRSLAGDGEPPPRAAFLLFDRPRADPGQPLDPQTIPRLMGQMLLFGRQTDREARLEVLDVDRRNLDAAKTLLAELGAGQLGSPSAEEVTERVSATLSMLTDRWALPEGTPREDVMRLSEQAIEEAMLVRWPQMPLGLLEGKSPQEAAGDASFRLRLLAAILVVDHWLEARHSRFDVNRLRRHLGLPALEPIDPEGVQLKGFPLVRLSRLVADKLSDEALLGVYHRAMAFNAHRAIRVFARAITERPGFKGKEEQLHAFMSLARSSRDGDEALQYVDGGRRAAEAAGRSSAEWDLFELVLRFQRREGREAMRLIQHLQQQHAREPGVTEALTELLVEVGLLHPEGAMRAPGAAQAEAAPEIVVPGAPGAEPGKLWTPHGQEAQREKPKLWVPGME